MKKIFESVANLRPKKSAFDLSHERKMSFKLGKLYPILFQEVIPADFFSCKSEVFLRFPPMLAPVMHRFNAYVHYFFVPNRLIWNEWEKFITGGEQGLDAPIHPYINLQMSLKEYFVKGRLPDYLGLPVLDNVTSLDPHAISALPFRAYQLIYNEYYRDQNLTSAVDFSTDSGVVSNTTEIDVLTRIRNSAWEKDYFTSATPWAQRGADPTIPMDAQYMDTSLIKASDGTTLTAGTLKNDVAEQLTDTAGKLAKVENIESISMLISDLRKAIKLKEWLERQATAGSRYVETILGHFSERLDDYRAMRPVYLGGGKQPVVISEVLSTYENSVDNLPQGNMSGHGISVGSSNEFKAKFKEHGFIIGLLKVIPNATYQQGIHRTWKRFDKFDYAWPEFAHIGEQEIKNSELYFEDIASGNELTFGYQQRYAEYKYGVSTVHGDFRDNLSYWHAGRIFTTRPSLNSTFVACNPDTRIFNVTDPDVDNVYGQIYNQVNAVRPLPYFGTPRTGGL